MQCFLNITGADLPSSLSSAGAQLPRAVSSGSHDYSAVSNESAFPMTEPIEKLEGRSQCSGEAEYTDDIPMLPNELRAAYVMTTVAKCDVVSVDATAALAMQGVVDFVDATDVPGVNYITGKETVLNPGHVNEEIFTTGRSRYAGQAVGLIVADTFENARAAAKAVVLAYDNEETPVLTIADAVAQGKTGPKMRARGRRGAAVPTPRVLQSVSGEFETGSQYPFHMEVQSCLVRPIEEGQFEVMSSTQHMHGVQGIVASVLGTPKNKINVTVKSRLTCPLRIGINIDMVFRCAASAAATAPSC